MSKTNLLPEYISIVQNTSLDFYNKSTNLLTAIGDFLAELDENIKFNRSLVTVDMINSYANLYNELNNTDFTVTNYVLQNGNVVESGVKTMDNNFKLFFIEKYLSLSVKFKDRINAIAGNTNYLAPFSDDIGYITDTQAIMDNNVSPYFDVFSIQYAYQNNLPATTNKKVSRNELIISKTFTFYTDALLKVNLKGLQSGILSNNTARLPHGTNLITDILYYERALRNNQTFLSELQLLLGEISNFILFFKQLNPQDNDPQRKAVFVKYTITNLENLQLNVDIIKNNLNKVALSTKTVLAVNPSQ